MSTIDPWIQNLEVELRQLVAVSGEIDDEDSWRLLVLLARVSQLPSPPRVLEELVAHVGANGLFARARSRVVLPDVSQILDDLDVALHSQDDPAGRLADVLLELDDLLGVLDMEGGEQVARAVAAHAVVLVELAPIAASTLDQWAVRRLATLDEDASAGALWSAVQAAACAATVFTLPSSSARADVEAVLRRAGGKTPARTAEIIDLFRTVPAMDRAWRAAAADFGTPWDAAEGEAWTVYQEGGDTIVQVQATPGRTAPRRVTVMVESANRTWTWTVPAERRSRQAAWFRLGTEAAIAKRFEQARAELGAGVDSPVRVSLTWSEDEGA